MEVRCDAATEIFRQEVRTWLEANGPCTPMPCVPKHGTNVTRVRFGALNMRTGRWICLVRERMRKEDFLAFLEHLLVAHSPGPIVLIKRTADQDVGMGWSFSQCLDIVFDRFAKN